MSQFQFILYTYNIFYKHIFKENNHSIVQNIPFVYYNCCNKIYNVVLNSKSNFEIMELLLYSYYIDRLV